MYCLSVVDVAFGNDNCLSVSCIAVSRCNDNLFRISMTGYSSSASPSASCDMTLLRVFARWFVRVPYLSINSLQLFQTSRSNTLVPHKLYPDPYLHDLVFRVNDAL
eukprot:652598_1